MLSSRSERDLLDWEGFCLGEWGFRASRLVHINKRLCKLKDDRFQVVIEVVGNIEEAMSMGFSFG